MVNQKENAMTRKRALVFLTAVVGVCLASAAYVAYAGGPPKDATYMGAKKCMACHMGQYKTYAKTKHAAAFNTLLADEKKNPECVKCHVTGFGQPGGFVNEEKTPGLENVGCESCHGPASAHIAAAQAGPEGEWDKKINKVPQNTCVSCHNPHIDRKEMAEKLRAAKGEKKG